MKAAEAAEMAKDVQAAITKRREVLSAMEANASALETADQYVAALHELARAVMWSGDDAQTRKIMADAARMSPGFKLEPEKYSRLYRKWFVAVAKQVVDDKPGELRLQRVVEVDGRRAAP